MTSIETKLREAAASADRAQDHLAITAHDAHEAGMTWQQIADALGITRQAASARYTSPVLKHPSP